MIDIAQRAEIAFQVHQSLMHRGGPLHQNALQHLKHAEENALAQSLHMQAARTGTKVSVQEISLESVAVSFFSSYERDKRPSRFHRYIYPLSMTLSALSIFLPLPLFFPFRMPSWRSIRSTWRCKRKLPEWQRGAQDFQHRLDTTIALRYVYCAFRLVDTRSSTDILRSSLPAFKVEHTAFAELTTT